MSISRPHPCARAEGLAHGRQNFGAGQRPRQQGVDEDAILVRQPGERQPDLVGDGPPGSEWSGKGQLSERVRVAERAHWESGLRSDGLHDDVGLAGQRRPWQHEPLRRVVHPVGVGFAPALAVLAVAVQRDRTADRQEGAGTLIPELDPELLVEEPPPHHDRFAGELRVDLVGDAGDRHAAVQGDSPSLGLRRNKLARRLYDSYDHIMDACCAAWNFLNADSERIKLIAMQDWANVS